MVNQWSQYSTDDAADDFAENGNGNVLSQYDFAGYDQDNSFWIILLYILGFAVLTYIALLPPAKKIEKIEVGSMTQSAVKSMFQKTQKNSTTNARSVSFFGAADQNLLRDTLCAADTHAPDEDDIILPQIQYNVDFYRVSTGVMEKSEGCTVTFKNLNYIVTSRCFCFCIYFSLILFLIYLFR